MPPSRPPAPDPLSGRFGLDDAFLLDREQRRLLIHGQPAALGSRALEVLFALADRPGELVRKSELLDLVWPDVDVDENNLQVQVSALRRCVGPDLIQTVPGRGYRLVALGSRPQTQARTLTHRLTALIDRENELSEILDALDRTALVTLVGAGGVGKTLLARHVAEGRRARKADAVCWVDLSAVEEPSQVLPAVALGLGVQVGAGDEFARLVDAAFGLSLTLVIDNAEHQLPAVARLVAALHAGASGIELLVTSQAPLGIPGECVYRLAALAVPEPGARAEQLLGCGAVRLFSELARAVDRRFSLGVHNVATVAAICRGLDGLPLALELAAAQVPRLGIAGILQAIAERGLLAPGLTLEQPGRPARHRTVQATLAWSHSLLDPVAQRTLSRLAVIAGRASLPVVLAIAVAPGDDADAVLDALFTLVDRSLVEVSMDDPPRYRLLEIPRAFAAEALRVAGEEAATRARHGAAYAAIFERAFQRYLQAEVRLDEWEDALEPELADARAAWQWALGHHASLAIALATTSWLALQNRVLQRMTAEWEATLACIAPDTPMHLQARAWWAAARALGASAPTRSLALARQAVAAAQCTEDLSMRALALSQLVDSAAYAGEAEGAEVQSAQAELQSLNLPESAVLLRYLALTAQCTVASFSAQLPQALTLRRQLAVLEQRLGQRHPVALQNLADTELAASNVEVAIDLGERLLQRMAGSRSLAAMTVVRLNLAAALLTQGGPVSMSRSLALLREAWAGTLHYGHKGVAADYLACIAAQQHRPRCAARLLGYSDRAYDSRGAMRQQNERRAYEQARVTATSALDAASMQALHSEGALLGDVQAAAIAFAETDRDPAEATAGPMEVVVLRPS